MLLVMSTAGIFDEEECTLTAGSQLEMSEEVPREDLKADQSNGESGKSDAPSPERMKASIYDI